MWGSRTSQARTPDRRYRRIRTCLPGEVESSSSPILRQAPDVRHLEKVGCRPDRIVAMRYPEKVGCRQDRIATVRYLEKVGCRSDRIAAVRYPEKVGCRPDRIAAVKHPDKVERWPGKIPDVRHPDGTSENFRPGGMSDATCRKGPSVRPKEREPCGTF